MKLLLIIRRFNGDVLLTSPLINKLKERFPGSRIDILVNDNTRAVASFIDGIDNIICFDQSFREKRGINRFLSRLSLEIDLLKKIFRKYDLAINLTATDSSNLYAFLSAEKSIGVVEKGDFRKNWWKRLILSKTFEEDSDENILLHNTRPLSYLKIAKKDLHVSIKTGDKDLEESYDLIGKERPFVIIHPSSQFFYKTWPIEKTLRIAKKIKKTGLEVVFTGGKGEVDIYNSQRIPEDIGVNLIGRTSLGLFNALLERCHLYIGMDTLNTHLSAALDRPTVAVFGPTFVRRWSPWSREVQGGAGIRSGIQRYGNITLITPEDECSGCGLAGCEDNNRSRCKALENMSVERVWEAINKTMLEKNILN